MEGINDRFWSLWDRSMDPTTTPTPDGMENDPFSWPPAPTPPPRYATLNDELIRYEQRPFGGDGYFLDSGRDDRDAMPPPISGMARLQLEEALLQQHTEDYDPPSDPPGAFSIGDLTLRRIPNERSFLEWYPRGDATLTFQNDEKSLQSIHNLNLDIIAGRSTVLAMAFEDSRSGPRLFLETLTSATAFPFLRFLYSGTYALTGPHGDFFEDVPTSVLLHCQLYHLGEIYDLEDMRTQAYVNVIRQCEFGCSSPEKPIDLCAAIRYTYQHLPTHKRLINTILDYCVSCFLRHRLGQDEEFKTLAYELRPFHQALCMNSRERDFENDAAAAIIQLPFKPYVPETYASREDALADRFDDVFHFHDDIDSPSKKRKRPESTLTGTAGRRELPLRLHQGWGVSTNEKTIGEEVESNLENKRPASSMTELPASSKAALTVRNKAGHGISLPAESSRATSDESDSEEELPKVKQQEISNYVDDFAVSDSEFEVIQGPGEVEAISDSDSDSSDVVKVDRMSTGSDTSRPGQASSSKPNADVADDDSDTEWQML